MSWSSTARRSAVSGLARLWCRDEWRSSDHADEIKRVLVDMLADQDAVNRLHAAQVTPLLGDNGANLSLIRQRLLAERHTEVAAVLMQRLAKFRDAHPDDVDGIVADVLVVEPWATALQAKSQGSRDTAVEAIVGLVLYLALRWRTPTATRLVDDWFRHSSESDVGRRALLATRPWLELRADRTEERCRAFVLLRLAATALEELRGVEYGNGDVVRDIHLCADSIVSDVYFASGAHTSDGEVAREPDPGFADQAFDTLEVLTGFKNPSTVHHAVEALAHLAPVDPPRAFLLVNAFVKSGDAYTYDSLAANAVVTLIERYLAEFREHLVANADLLTAVRSVLDAFVRAGWPAGVALSYRLGDAFR